MKHVEKYIGIALLFFAVGFSLWTFRSEPFALVDPNDNTFQFALVDRTNQIWDFAVKKCSSNYLTFGFCHLSFLVDHWVPNWAEGYNLPYYYSHIPQILIVASYRLSSWFLSLFTIYYSLFTFYHWVIYLLLCLFPVSVFLALRVTGISGITAGIGALIASHLSTDGLYGLDPSSFLWRGYGLSSQLFAMIWLPLSLAYSWRYFAQSSNVKAQISNQVQNPKFKKTNMAALNPLSFGFDLKFGFGNLDLLRSVFFLAATTAGHLGIGIIAFMSAGILALSPFVQSLLTHTWDRAVSEKLKETIGKLLFLFGSTGLLLGYWIMPILKDGNYHNISVWDGIWKFDSFGYRDVLNTLFNGDLFDFGRFPILTIVAVIGFFSAASSTYFGFALLFAFWLLMYFGRTTWGGLFTLIPGMSEYHLSRFIVGVHITGLFLIPIGVDWLVTSISSYIVRMRRFATLALYYGMVIVVVAFVYPQTLRYAAHNDFLITRGNQNAMKDQQDVDLLLSTINSKLSTKPGRVFAGRGGSWGVGFRLAETPMYMHLSTYGIPVVLWLPETWSPNSDTEQYFSENNSAHYSLYNVRFVATPADLPKDQIQPFWKLVETGKTWKLYEVATDGYITAGVRPAIVSSTKSDYRSVIRLWMHSDAYTQGLFPALTFDKAYPKQTGLPNFRMTDEVTYKTPDMTIHNLFAEAPLYLPPGVTSLQQFNALKKETYAPISVDAQSEQGNMIFSSRITVADPCRECIVVLKQSFHPSWRATVDGKPADTFAVFPFYTALKLETPGVHEVVFAYRPSVTKQLLLLVGLVTLGLLTMIILKKHKN